jgi:putative phosphoserine phosphatase/1-acylglycerol-3-phosphate O-acyltransferase
VANSSQLLGAAFIDLDRTLLSGASGPIISAALRHAGVVSATRIPGEDALYRIFNAVGENLPSMLLARQGASIMKGKARHDVVAAAHTACDELMKLVRPLAASVISGHREAGRKVVLATTTPHDFIATFARRMGFDDVVATRFMVDGSGAYTGELDGPFTWSAGKLAAVRTWCNQHDIALSESYAYSDSVYDEPLLNAVGYPQVVNPDARLTVMAAARRWPIVSLNTDGVAAKPPLQASDIQKVGLLFARPEAFPFVKFSFSGIENIPSTGPVVLVANHRSYFDVFAVALTVAKSGRTVRFLGKKEVFDAPVIGQLASLLGGIRVDRASGSDEPLAYAAEALSSGEMVVIMPQGTIPRGPAFFEPQLRGRWGAAKLARMTNALVVPIGLWGTEKVWPRNAKYPNVLNFSQPPTVDVVVGQPMQLTSDDADANTTRIMTEISALLPEAARATYEPTDDEVKRTYPSSYKGDPRAETLRRPGTD